MIRDFIAIDFETANQQPSSVCSVGVVMVRDGQIVNSFYNLIQPEPNYYNYWCQRVHGISESDTEDAPVFSKVWQQLEERIVEIFFSDQDLDDVRYQIATIPFVAHNQTITINKVSSKNHNRLSLEFVELTLKYIHTVKLKGVMSFLFAKIIAEVPK